MAFYFASGPWRGCWVRLGYDPRQHPKALFWQVLELRAFFNKDLRKDTRQSAADLNNSHILHENIDPLTIAHLFQLCDIHYAPIQKLLQTFAINATYHNHTTGWLSSADKQKIIDMVKNTWAPHLAKIRAHRSTIHFPISFNRPSRKKSTLVEDDDDDVLNGDTLFAAAEDISQPFSIPQLDTDHDLDAFSLLEADDDE